MILILSDSINYWRIKSLINRVGISYILLETYTKHIKDIIKKEEKKQATTKLSKVHTCSTLREELVRINASENHGTPGKSGLF